MALRKSAGREGTLSRIMTRAGARPGTTRSKDRYKNMHCLNSNNGLLSLSAGAQSLNQPPGGRRCLRSSLRSAPNLSAGSSPPVFRFGKGLAAPGLGMASLPVLSTHLHLLIALLIIPISFFVPRARNVAHPGSGSAQSLLRDCLDWLNFVTHPNYHFRQADHLSSSRRELRTGLL